MRFGTAGIRGIFGEDVSVRETLAVCFAVSEFVGRGKKRKFGVGYDSRKSSLILANLACAGMNWYGSDVQEYGMIPTPVLAYSIKRNHLDAGFSVTASHNPPEYAGIKVFGANGIEFSLEAEHRLEELMQRSSEFMKREEELRVFGRMERTSDSISVYNENVLLESKFKTKRVFRILVDCANGTSCEATPQILSQLGHEVFTVNSHSSSIFPGRLPEPCLDTLKEVGNLVLSTGCDFGIAHDGDADRLVMIDGHGTVVPDYALSVLVMKIILEREKHGTIVLSYNASDVLESVALENGCSVTRSRLGKTFQELYKRNGIFACEPSKMVDPAWGYWEDGIYCAALVVQYLSNNSLSLDQALEQVPKRYNLRVDMNVDSVLDYDKIGKGVEDIFEDKVMSIEGTDGIKVRFKDMKGWVMIRSSGTEKKVRIYSESSSPEGAGILLERGVRSLTP